MQVCLSLMTKNHLRVIYCILEISSPFKNVLVSIGLICCRPLQILKIFPSVSCKTYTEQLHYIVFGAEISILWNIYLFINTLIKMFWANFATQKFVSITVHKLYTNFGSIISFITIMYSLRFVHWKYNAKFLNIFSHIWLVEIAHK